MNKWLILVLLHIIMFNLSAQEPAEVPTPQPVPENQIKNGVMTVSRYNFKLTLPGSDWKAQVLAIDIGGEKIPSYLLTHPGEEFSFVLTIIPQDSPKMEMEIDQFMKGMNNQITSSGAEIKKQTRTKVDYPMPGSYKIFTKALYNNEMVINTFNHLITHGHVYLFQYQSLEEEMDPDFEKVVRSFKIIKKADPVMAPAAENMEGEMETNSVFLMLGGFFWVAVISFICQLINRFTGRYVVNGGVVAAAFIVLAMIVLMFRPYLTGGDSGPETSSYYQGQIFGAFLFPLILSVYVAKRFKRESEKRMQLGGTGISELPTSNIEHSTPNEEEGEDEHKFV